MARNGYSLHGITISFQVLGAQTIGKANTGSKPVDRALNALASARTHVSVKTIDKHDVIIGIAQEACRSLKPRKHPVTGKPCHYRLTDAGPVIFKSYSEAKADYDVARAAVEKALGDDFVWSRDWQAVGAMHRSRRLRVTTK